MISPEQIAAARAFLHANQEKLSKIVNVSAKTIRRYENGYAIKTDTLRQIQEGLEAAGIEFKNDNSVAYYPKETKIHMGQVGADFICNDIIQTVKEKGGTLAVTFDTQQNLTETFGVIGAGQRCVFKEVTKYAAIKCLISEIPSPKLAMPTLQFRVTTRKISHCTLVYGNKTVIAVFDSGSSVYVHMRSAHLAQKQMNNFESDWSSAVAL